MPDMLVKLYALPDLEPELAHARARGVLVRRALAPEKRVVIDWVDANFPASAAEADIAFARSPVACFVATRQRDLVGFSCYDATAPNFFGPEGVVAKERGNGIGRALLLAALHAQRAQGYAYSIIGGVGPAAFYEKSVGAVVIPDSSPGIYAPMLRGSTSR